MHGFSVPVALQFLYMFAIRFDWTIKRRVSEHEGEDPPKVRLSGSSGDPKIACKPVSFNRLYIVEGRNNYLPNKVIITYRPYKDLITSLEGSYMDFVRSLYGFYKALIRSVRPCKFYVWSVIFFATKL